MSDKIFISYRREDTAGDARSVYERLTQRVSADQVFMDVDAIAPGADFHEVINNAVGSSAVLLAIIGKGWLDTDPETGTPRIGNPNDFVRLEIAAALERSIRVIPVLIDDASMPSEDDLTADLRSLVRRNALEIRHTRFNDDIDNLVDAVMRIVKPGERGGRILGKPRHNAKPPEHEPKQDQTKLNTKTIIAGSVAMYFIVLIIGVIENTRPPDLFISPLVLSVLFGIVMSIYRAWKK